MTLALAHYEPSTQPQTAPHNLDAEQAFLGAILYDNAVYHRVALYWGRCYRLWLVIVDVCFEQSASRESEP